MAISGEGRILDPYIVENYTDFKTVLQGEGTYWTNNQVIYIRLEGNVSSSTWENMTNGDHFCKPNINLNDYSLNMGDNSLTGTALPLYTQLQNGRVNNDNKNLSSITMNNVRMVSNGVTFMGCKWYNSKLQIGLGFTSSRTRLFAQTVFECCDVSLNLTLTGARAEKVFYGRGWTTVNPSYAYRSRFKGKISGVFNYNNNNYFLADGQSASSLFAFYESVINVDLSDVADISNHGSIMRCDSILSYINTDTLPTNLTADNMTNLTTAQITNGAYLRSVGFPVLNEVITP